MFITCKKQHNTAASLSKYVCLLQLQELKDGEEVLARWTDCRYYPAKIESVNKEGKCPFSHALHHLYRISPLEPV